MARQIALDTETTGMNKFGVPHRGHKIIEIGAVEILNRRVTNNQFHTYINPKRTIDMEAFRVHGISSQFLSNQPVFSEIADSFLSFIQNSELIIHNASFDLGFLNYEFQNYNSNFKKIESYCIVTDSLKLARKMFPGQRNNLDALCERYFINNDKRNLHNALIDAQLLAQVFLSMTGGQIKIQFAESNNTNATKPGTNDQKENNSLQCLDKSIQKSLKIVFADVEEQLEHQKYLDFLEKNFQNCLWKQFD